MPWCCLGSVRTRSLHCLYEKRLPFHGMTPLFADDLDVLSGTNPGG